MKKTTYNGTAQINMHMNEINNNIRYLVLFPWREKTNLS